MDTLAGERCADGSAARQIRTPVVAAGPRATRIAAIKRRTTLPRPWRGLAGRRRRLHEDVDPEALSVKGVAKGGQVTGQSSGEDGSGEHAAPGLRRTSAEFG